MPVLNARIDNRIPDVEIVEEKIKQFDKLKDTTDDEETIEEIEKDIEALERYNEIIQ